MIKTRKELAARIAACAFIVEGNITFNGMQDLIEVYEAHVAAEAQQTLVTDFTLFLGKVAEVLQACEDTPTARQDEIYSAIVDLLPKVNQKMISLQQPYGEAKG